MRLVLRFQPWGRRIRVMMEGCPNCSPACRAKHHRIVYWDPGQGGGEVEMLYQSPADFCTELFEEALHREEADGTEWSLHEVTVVSEAPDTARVEAVWFGCGHVPDAGYYDVFERTAFVLVKRGERWHLHSQEFLGYE
jgi:hypothetical protein